MAAPRTKPARAPAKVKPRAVKSLSKAEVARVDAAIKKAKGSPGYEMVRTLGELAKLGPYPAFKKYKAA